MFSVFCEQKKNKKTTWGPLCKIQKLQSPLCKIQKHYILPVHCWIATFLTCCLKLWLLTAELPSCQITEWKMSWQTISGDGFAPINVLDQIPMGSAHAQRLNKDRFLTFIIWTSSKRLEDAIAAACHYFGQYVVPEWKPKGSHKVIICPVPILITRSGSCNVTFQSCLEISTSFKHSSINQGCFA